MTIDNAHAGDRIGDELTERAAPRTLTVLCLSDSDTRLKWTTTVASAIATGVVAELPAFSTSSISVASLSDGAVPSERQLAENAVCAPYLVIEHEQLQELLHDGVDVLVVNAVGSRLARTIDEVRRLEALGVRRPIVVTGYAGVVYEKHVEGIVWRLGADVVCCNSGHDFDLFSEVATGLGCDPGVLTRSGLAIVEAARRRAAADPTWPPHNVTFAVQPDVPRRRQDRVYLLERLVSYARAHPARTIVVKLRARPDESTTHRERHHYEQLFDSAIVDRPPNLRFEYGPMASALDRCDLLLTVSSTAALEAVALGVPAGIITDVGIGESLGNHLFVGSGLLVSMADVDADIRPTPDAQWCRRHGLSALDTSDAVVTRVAELLEQAAAGYLSPVPRGFVDDRHTPRLLARVADRVGPDLQTHDDGSATKTAVSRLLRGPARRLYERLDRWTRS